MAITQASLTSGFDGQASTTSYATASVSPTANRLVLASFLGIFNTPGQAADPTLSGASMTWTKVASSNDTAAGMNLITFRALAASPGSGALTINYGGPFINLACWSIVEFDGIDTGGTNGANAVVQSATNKNITGTVATVTATLSAFGSVDNGAYSAHGWFNVTPEVSGTPDTGWTEIHETGSPFLGNALAGRIETQWLATNDTTALCTWSGNGGVMALALQLKAAAAGGGQPTTKRFGGVAFHWSKVGRGSSPGGVW